MTVLRGVSAWLDSDADADADDADADADANADAYANANADADAGLLRCGSSLQFSGYFFHSRIWLSRDSISGHPQQLHLRRHSGAHW